MEWAGGVEAAVDLLAKPLSGKALLLLNARDDGDTFATAVPRRWSRRRRPGVSRRRLPWHVADHGACGALRVAGDGDDRAQFV